MPFLITSSATEDAKLITSVVIAIYSAKASMKTPLVDLDLRRSACTGFLTPVPRNHGLIQAFQIQNVPDLDELPIKTGVANPEMVSSLVPADLSLVAQFVGRARNQNTIISLDQRVTLR